MPANLVARLEEEHRDSYYLFNSGVANPLRTMAHTKMCHAEALLFHIKMGRGLNDFPDEERPKACRAYARHFKALRRKAQKALDAES